MYSSNNLIKKPNSKLFGAFMMLVAFISAGCNNTTTSKYKIDVINGTGGGNFNAGEKVTITATTPSDKQFNYWELEGKNVSTENPYTFTVSKNASYTAIFKNQQVTVSVLNGTGGGTFDKGSSVTITATVPDGKVFDYWIKNGEKDSTVNPLTFTADKDVTYAAIFKSANVNIQVKNGKGGGSFKRGSEVTITANDDTEDQSFDHWECNGKSVSTERKYTFTANEDGEYIAIFNRGIIKTDTNPIDVTTIDVSKGGTITIDYRYKDKEADKDNAVSLAFGSDDSTYFGEYKIYHDRLESTYQGITLTSLDDGYNRITVRVKQLTTTNGAPTSVSKVLFKSFAPTKGVYFVVKSEPIEDASTNRGIFEKKGSNHSISFWDTYTVSDGGTLVLDYKFVDPETDKNNGVNVFFGSDDTNRFGGFKILSSKLEENYSGITFMKLDDGYNRMIVNISKLEKVRSGETKPTVISEVSFKWFEVTKGVYFDINPKTTKTSKTTEFTMSGDSFKIVNFADTHIDDRTALLDTGTVGKTIKYAIDTSKPDIILFSGDLVASAAHLGYFFEYMDTYKTPYFLILGNHDHEGSLNYDVIANYANRSDYGYIEKGPEDFETDHEGNYTIKIKNSSDTLVHSIIMMSTGNKYKISDESNVDKFTGTKVDGVKYGSYNSYTTYCDGTKIGDDIAAWDGIRGENQQKWYEDTAKGLRCSNTLVCHAGFNEYVKAYEAYKSADEEEKKAFDPKGQCNMGEPCCGSIEKTGLFDKIKSNDTNTKNVICGHDHVNDFSLVYEGVRLTYALKTGTIYSEVKTGERNGYTELTVNSDGTTSLDQIYFNPLSN